MTTDSDVPLPTHETSTKEETARSEIPASSPSSDPEVDDTPILIPDLLNNTAAQQAPSASIDDSILLDRALRKIVKLEGKNHNLMMLVNHLGSKLERLTTAYDSLAKMYNSLVKLVTRHAQVNQVFDDFCKNMSKPRDIEDPIGLNEHGQIAEDAAQQELQEALRSKFGTDKIEDLFKFE